VLLVRTRGGPRDDPVSRYECHTREDAKARAEKFAADNDLYLT